MSLQEFQAAQPSRKAARRIRPFVDVLWRAAEPIVDLAETVHREGGGALRPADAVGRRGQAA
jgi:hypothetical protein